MLSNVSRSLLSLFTSFSFWSHDNTKSYNNNNMILNKTVNSIHMDWWQKGINNFLVSNRIVLNVSNECKRQKPRSSLYPMAAIHGCNSYHETNFIFLNETHFFKLPVFEEKMTVIKICHFSPKFIEELI